MKSPKFVSRERDTGSDHVVMHYRCGECDWHLVDNDSPPRIVRQNAKDAWCLCEPWTIAHVHVGQVLGGAVVCRVDRFANTVSFTGTDKAVPFSSVQRPE